ncbi:MAG: type II toxin-antitoxin system HicA family toxin [Candidatus Hydrothermarchaeaceae archaeon]
MKLPAVSGANAIKALGKTDFVFVRQRGSHVRLEKVVENEVIKITVPLRKTLKKGTLRRILKDAKVTVDEFTNLL